MLSNNATKPAFEQEVFHNARNVTPLRDKQREALLYEVRRRYRRPKPDRRELVVTETERLIAHLHGEPMRQSDRAIADLQFLAVVHRRCKGGEDRFGHFVRVHAPWFGPSIEVAWDESGGERWPKRQQISKRLGLTLIVRRQLGLRMLLPSDLSAAEWEQRNADRRRMLDRLRKKAKRAQEPPREAVERISDKSIMRRAIVAAYDKLAAHTGAPVAIAEIRSVLKRANSFKLDAKGQLTGAARKMFCQAKGELVASKRFGAANGFVWHTTLPNPCPHTESLYNQRTCGGNVENRLAA